MPKQSLKMKVARTCAFACIVGLSGNTFVVAGKSFANTKTKSVRVFPNAPTAEPSPEPTPLSGAVRGFAGCGESDAAAG